TDSGASLPVKPPESGPERGERKRAVRRGKESYSCTATTPDARIAPGSPRSGPLSAALFDEVERDADARPVRTRRVELRPAGDALDAAHDRGREPRVARRRRRVDLAARRHLDEDDELAGLRRILLEAALVAALGAREDLAADDGL